ncbi:MAG: ribonuclease III [Deltaproteobacteria bacterium]
MNRAVVEERIGYRFRDPSLLEEALRHGSASGHDSSRRSYERLEFLGDSVLNLCVAQEVYRAFPTAGEGVLTKARAAIINNRNLAGVGERIGLPESLRIDPSVRKKGGGITRKMTADAVEAILGAIFLDGGHAEALRFVRSRFRFADLPDAFGARFDAKSRLQEWCQRERLPLPAYRLLSTEGPPHDRRFRVEVRVDGVPRAEGTGTSRKEAETEAAEKAIERFGREGMEAP